MTYLRLRLMYAKLERLFPGRKHSLEFIARVNVSESIRLSITDAPQMGGDPDVDRLIELATFKVHRPEYFDQFLGQERIAALGPEDREHVTEKIDELTKRSEEIDKTIANAKSLPIFCRWASILQLSNHLGVNLRSSEQFTDILHLLVARQYEPGAKPFEIDEVRKLRKEGARAITQIQKELSEREALKIDFQIAYVSPAIATISAVALLIGYFYCIWYYGHFGVDVSRYLGINDYLSASLEKVRIVILGAAYSGVILFARFHSGTRKSAAQIQYERSKQDLLLIMIWLSIISMNFLMITDYFYRDLRILIFSIDILLLGYLIAPKLANHYFKKPFPAWFALALFFATFAELFRVVYTDINHVQKKLADPEHCEGLIFDDNVSTSVDRCDIVALGASSGYVFVIVREENAVKAIPRSLIAGYDSGKYLAEETLFNQVNDYLNFFADKLRPFVDPDNSSSK